MLMRLFRNAALLPPPRQGPFKGPEDILRQALPDRKRRKGRSRRRSAQWAQEELASGQCRAPIREQLCKILFKP